MEKGRVVAFSLATGVLAGVFTALALSRNGYNKDRVHPDVDPAALQEKVREANQRRAHLNRLSKKEVSYIAAHMGA